MDKGAILSALSVTSLAGAFSLFNLLVTKDEKISEFRQAWIEAVRADISDVVAKGHLISGYIKTHKGSPAEFVAATGKSYTKINQASMRIRLRMNRKEPLHENLLAIMDEMEKMMDIGVFLNNPNCFKDLDVVTTKFVLAGANLLKAEWERVKTGERVYRAGKWITGIILVASFLTLMGVLLFFKSSDTETPSKTTTYIQSLNAPKSQH